MRPDIKSYSTTVQNALLLKALQDFTTRVIVHVNDAKPQQKSADWTLASTAKEAVELITALTHFISNIVKASTSDLETNAAVATVDPEADTLDEPLVEEGTTVEDSRNISTLRTPRSNQILDIVPVTKTHTPPKILELDTASMVPVNNQLRSPSVDKHLALLYDQAMQELRRHIFNKMPIRLLCFKPQGSTVAISLLERDAIYTHLASVIQTKMTDPAYHEQIEQIARTAGDVFATRTLVQDHTGYAILSHTWLRVSPGEITYTDWRKGSFHVDDPGYQKLAHFGRVTCRDYGLTFGWMDTVCINKESSSELDESIRSMYNWYQRSTVCITYLAATETLSDIHRDPWFTRGWTLQELLASYTIKFYNRQWVRLTDHYDTDKECDEINAQITMATTLTSNELMYIRSAPISRRMQLAAVRQVTREEDAAYSLMGIFNVSIPIAYGEGADGAFYRLLQAILSSTSEGILDLFNWGGPLPERVPFISSILPPRAESYLRRSLLVDLQSMRPSEPLTLTHLGLRIPVLLMPGISVDGRDSAHKPIGWYSAIITIATNPPELPTMYHLLDDRVSGPDGDRDNKPYSQYTFAVFNLEPELPGFIAVRRRCIALGLQCFEDAGEVTNTGRFYRIETAEPIEFDLEGGFDFENTNGDQIKIRKSSLRAHGMQFIAMYL